MMTGNLDGGSLDRYWYRDAVGGMWNEIGMLQYEFMLSRGLKPEHYFLDFGCGSLRGGRLFINYLDSGRYFGVDKNASLIEAGLSNEISHSILEPKKPILRVIEDFNLSSLQAKFQYALAQSVFTHLPISGIKKCLINIESALADEGEFYATFFECPAGRSKFDSLEHIGGITTFFDQDPFHYEFETFPDLCRKSGLSVEYIGDWGHPRDQKMMFFHRR